jgi:hypothetical protein
MVKLAMLQSAEQFLTAGSTTIEGSEGRCQCLSSQMAQHGRNDIIDRARIWRYGWRGNDRSGTFFRRASPRRSDSLVLAISRMEFPSRLTPSNVLAIEESADAIVRFPLSSCPFRHAWPRALSRPWGSALFLNFAIPSRQTISSNHNSPEPMLSARGLILICSDAASLRAWLPDCREGAACTPDRTPLNYSSLHNRGGTNSRDCRAVFAQDTFRHFVHLALPLSPFRTFIPIYAMPPCLSYVQVHLILVPSHRISSAANLLNSIIGI